jgi:hypothetical protein
VYRPGHKRTLNGTSLPLKNPSTLAGDLPQDRAALEDLDRGVTKEHHLVDDIVERLKDTPFDDEHWAARLTVTRENVERHIEEEAEMFRLRARSPRAKISTR